MLEILNNLPPLPRTDTSVLLKEKYDLIFVDFEVFPNNVLLCAWDIREDMWQVLWKPEHIRVFLATMMRLPNKVFAGFNTRNYDNIIAAGILQGFDEEGLFHLNNAMIYADLESLNDYMDKDYETVKDMRFRFPGIWDFARKCWDVGFDMGTKMIGEDKVPQISLKRWQEYNDIEPLHCPIPFGKPFLTDIEQDIVAHYCQYDVASTARMAATEMLADWELRCGFVNELGTRVGWHSTYPKMTSVMFDADASMAHDMDDMGWRYEKLRLGKHSVSKNKRIMDYFNLTPAEQDTQECYAEVCGLIHKFGTGGVHADTGEVTVVKDDNLMLADFSGMYPSIMAREGLIPKGMRNPGLFKEILQRRFRLKAKGDKREKPLKQALNSCYGASREKYSPLYDPIVGASVCANGQLLMVNLIERLEETGIRLIQSNTDGIFFVASDPDASIAVIEKFSKDTGYMVEVERYKELYQRNVNNYIAVDAKGRETVRGGWFRTAHKLRPSIVQLIHRAEIMGEKFDFDSITLEEAAITVTRDKNSVAFVIDGEEDIHSHTLQVLPVGFFDSQDIYTKRRDGQRVKARLCPDSARLLKDCTPEQVDWGYFDKDYDNVE